MTVPVPPEGSEGDIEGDDGLGSLLEEFCYMAVAFQKPILTKDDLVGMPDTVLDELKQR